MNFKAWISALFAALAAALLPACDIVNLPKIKPGVSTAAEVRARMGEPGMVHWNDDGTATWEYSRQPAGVDCYMISFDLNQVVVRLDQVLNNETYAKVRVGMTKDDIRRLLGAPASKAVFENLGEDIWEWHVRGMPPTEETYFMVHFDLRSGLVKKTSQRVAARG